MPRHATPLTQSASTVYDASASSAHRDYQRQRQMTLGDLLLENRIILLQGEIYDGNANELVMKLLYLQSENRRKDIHFYINSPGGSVTAEKRWTCGIPRRRCWTAPQAPTSTPIHSGGP